MSTAAYRTVFGSLDGHRMGSIEIIPLDEAVPIGLWQTVSRPVAVNEQITAAITRAKSGMH